MSTSNLALTSQLIATTADVSQLPCSVCGWPATGIHFGAVTCDACKAFFGRYLRRDPSSSSASTLNNQTLLQLNPPGCFTMGKCFSQYQSEQRVSSHRMRCASCRIAKCLSVGMSLNGSVAGRRSQAQRKAICEAVRGYYSSTKLEKSPTQVPSSYRSHSMSSSSNISPKYASMIEEIRKSTSDCSSIFFNGDEINFPQRAGSIGNFPIELKLGDGIALAKPAMLLPYSKALVLKDPARCEWLIGRVVDASTHLSKIAQNRLAIDRSMNPLEIWQSVMNNFVVCFKFVLQFVRALPGFDWLDNVSDRIKLFSNALFPILLLKLSIDFDKTTNIPYIFNLDQASTKIATEKLLLANKAASGHLESGQSMAQLGVNAAEFALMAGLLFFNDSTPGIGDTSKLALIRQDYTQALQMLCRSQSKTPNSRRFEDVKMHIEHFSTYTKKVLALMELRKKVYPSSVGMEPLFEEVTQQMSTIRLQ